MSKLHPLVRAPTLMDDWGKRLRRAASAATPPAPLQVALARCPRKKTKRACAGPCAVTLPGEGLGGDGVKARAGQGRAVSPQPSQTSQLCASATGASIVQQTLQQTQLNSAGSDEDNSNQPTQDDDVHW